MRIVYSFANIHQYFRALHFASVVHISICNIKKNTVLSLTWSTWAFFFTLLPSINFALSTQIWSKEAQSNQFSKEAYAFAFNQKYHWMNFRKTVFATVYLWFAMMSTVLRDYNLTLRGKRRSQVSSMTGEDDVCLLLMYVCWPFTCFVEHMVAAIILCRVFWVDIEALNSLAVLALLPCGFEPIQPPKRTAQNEFLCK